MRRSGSSMLVARVAASLSRGAGWNRGGRQRQVQLHPESPNRAPRQEGDGGGLIGRIGKGEGTVPGPGRGDLVYQRGVIFGFFHRFW